jgi:hypothetical protein
MHSGWRPLVVALVTATAGVVGLAWWWRRLPPQLPDDPAVFKTVDALWTAVLSRDPRAVEACQHRLAAYRQAGRLPPAAAQRLDRVIGRAQAGAWEAAAQDLYPFMFQQQRRARLPAPARKEAAGARRLTSFARGA